MEAALSSIYNTKVGHQDVVCDAVPPLHDAFDQHHIMGTWFQIMHVDEAPFTREKWTCGQTIYSTMDHRGSFLEHSVGQDGIHGPHYGSHGEMYCPAELDSGNCFVKYKDDHWLKQQVISTDYDNYAVLYRCLPQHGSYVTLLSRTPELDNEFLENIMFRIQYMLPNFNFQTLVRDIQGYHQCNYQAQEHHWSNPHHSAHGHDYHHDAPHHVAPHHDVPHHDVLHHDAPHHDAPHHDVPHYDTYHGDDYYGHGDEHYYGSHGDDHYYGDDFHYDVHADDYHHDPYSPDYYHDTYGSEPIGAHHDYYGDDHHYDQYVCGDFLPEWICH